MFRKETGFLAYKRTDFNTILGFNYFKLKYNEYYFEWLESKFLELISEHNLKTV